MDGDSSVNKLWWAIPAAVLLVLALLAMFVGSPPAAPRPGSSYDASPKGVRAAYLLLEGLGYNVNVSKRFTQGNSRWLLFPHEIKKEEEPGIVAWVRKGGRLLLADNDSDFAEALGLIVDAEHADESDYVLTVDGERLHLKPGTELITPHDQPDRVWPPDSDKPLAGVFRHGKGEIWIVYQPDFLQNSRLRDADNAIVLCRLFEAFADSDRVFFDEYFHGMRERPGPVELLFQPPALWVTLQGLALLGVLLWRSLPRFGALQEPVLTRRRSKEEFVDALGNLLEQKKAYNESFRIVRDALGREFEHALGLPPQTPPKQLASAALGTSSDAASLASVLSQEQLPHSSVNDFLRTLNEMERLRRLYFHERHDR